MITAVREIKDKVWSAYSDILILERELTEKELRPADTRLKIIEPVKQGFIPKRKQEIKTAVRGGRHWADWEIDLLKTWDLGNVRKCDKTIDYLIRKLGRTERGIQDKLKEIHRTAKENGNDN